MQITKDHVDYARGVAILAMRRRGIPINEDRLADAMVGLVEAAARFEPRRGATFQTFAHGRIVGAVLDGLRRDGGRHGRRRAAVEEARELLVAYYERFHGAPQRTVAAHRPVTAPAAAVAFGDLDAGAAMRVLRANLAALGAEVPVLYRHYVDLCEPGGARFLAFGVDPRFSGCTDGLVQLDLDRVRPRKRERWLGMRASTIDAGAANTAQPA